MGVNRDLKKATEAYWAGKLSQDELLKEGKRLRQAHWKLQKDAGIDVIPSNDFSFYDHVLDHIQLFGVSLPLGRFDRVELQGVVADNHIQAIPERYSKHKLSPIDEFFAMGRGIQRPAKDGTAAVDVPSLVLFLSMATLVRMQTILTFT